VDKKTGMIAGGAVALLIIGGAIGVAVGGGDDDNNKVKASGDETTTTIATTPSTDDNGGGDSGSGSGSGSEDPGSGNELPYFSNVDGEALFGDDDGNQVPFARIDGHAIDPDGHDDQEVDHVTIDWDDGNTTVATRGGNNAFSDQHSYESDFGGQTVNIKVTAVDDDGATVSRTVTLSLPSQ